MKKRYLLLAFWTSCRLISGGQEVAAQAALPSFSLSATTQAPKVSVDWQRYYDYNGLTEICKRLATAYPELVKLETIGDSYEGRRIWALTISDFSIGDPLRKPAYYLDGNIPSHEIQGVENALYTAWYLLENFYHNPFIQELLQQKTFYIIPTINPDGRHNLLHAADHADIPGLGMMPLDDDGDGLVDEDQPEDLNKDGHITLMRRKTLKGNYFIDPENPLLMVPAKPGQAGQYELLGFEGLDSDGDGSVNEDPPGYYNLNHDWGWNWQPDYILKGAYKYPFSLAENRAIKEFVMRRPNIAAAQNYQVQDGFNFLDPGTEQNPNALSPGDRQVYERLQNEAGQTMPDYPYPMTYQSLFTTFGGELDWFYGGRGIFTFSNPLLSPYLQANLTSATGQEVGQDPSAGYNLSPDALVEWTEFEHPTYGAVEIGGIKKNFVKKNPGPMLEQDAHRNMVFTLYQANQMPQLEVQEVETRKLSNGLTQVTATIANTRVLPTHTSHDLQHRIERPDYISLKDSTVVSGLVLEGGEMNGGKEQKLNPSRIGVPNIPGKGTVKVRWVVMANSPNLTIEVDSRKGGVVSRRF